MAPPPLATLLYRDGVDDSETDSKIPDEDFKREFYITIGLLLFVIMVFFGLFIHTRKQLEAEEKLHRETKAKQERDTALLRGTINSLEQRLSCCTCEPLLPWEAPPRMGRYDGASAPAPVHGHGHARGHGHGHGHGRGRGRGRGHTSVQDQEAADNRHFSGFTDYGHAADEVELTFFSENGQQYDINNSRQGHPERAVDDETPVSPRTRQPENPFVVGDESDGGSEGPFEEIDLNQTGGRRPRSINHEHDLDDSYDYYPYRETFAGSSRAQGRSDSPPSSPSPPPPRPPPHRSQYGVGISHGAAVNHEYDNSGALPPTEPRTI